MAGIKNWRLTCLIEDTVNRPQLLAEHGLSILVEAEGEAILFDTGQSDLIVRNAEKMGVDLSGVSKVALSHGHYDHTGGLLEVLRLAPEAMVFGHPAILGKKYAREKDGSCRRTGIPFSRSEVEQWCNGLQLDTVFRDISQGVFLSGEIPRETDFEEEEPSFFKDAGDGKQPDSMPDDQALIVDTSQGLVVIVGCAHAGVANTLRHVRERFPDRSISTLVGGMHLSNAPRQRLLRTVEALKEANVCHICAGHCTGWTTNCWLFKEFGNRFTPLSVNTVLEQGDMV
jgi:7,8-dihydropterin-6-yl-methyl-4-(beta-D-ribofuranosyl)aminobenzene 5'-phosphate synthase